MKPHRVLLVFKRGKKTTRERGVRLSPLVYLKMRPKERKRNKRAAFPVWCIPEMFLYSLCSFLRRLIRDTDNPHHSDQRRTPKEFVFFLGKSSRARRPPRAAGRPLRRRAQSQRGGSERIVERGGGQRAAERRSKKRKRKRRKNDHWE